MISWGTKADLVGEHVDTSLSTCKVCSKEGHAHYFIEQNYFLLYWLPVFRKERVIFKICPHCSFKSKLKKSNARVIDDFSSQKLEEINSIYPKKYKFKYFWGLVIYVLIFSLIGFLIWDFKYN